MRLEEITTRALERVNNDKYMLTVAVAQRAEELNKGAKPLVKMDPKVNKPTDIALHEIADGLLVIDKMIEK